MTSTRPHFNPDELNKKFQDTYTRHAHCRRGGGVVFGQFHQFFHWAASHIRRAIESNSDGAPFEAIVASHLAYFLENFPQADAEIVHAAFRDFATRYRDGNNEYVNANLGQLGKTLDKMRGLIPEIKKGNLAAARKIIPSIIWATAFATKACLTRPRRRNDRDPVCQIDQINNKTMQEQFSLFQEALSYAVEGTVTDQSVQDVMENNIFQMDLHIRSGTEDNGTKFRAFEKEVNEDGAIKGFLAGFPEYDGTPFRFNEKTTTKFEPIHLDLCLDF